MADIIDFRAKKTATREISAAKRKYEQTLFDLVESLDDMGSILFGAAFQLASQGPWREWSTGQPIGQVVEVTGEALIASGDANVIEVALVHRRVAEALAFFRTNAPARVARRAARALAQDSESAPIWTTFVGTGEEGIVGRVGFTNVAPGLTTFGPDGAWARDLNADLTRLRDDFDADLVVIPTPEAEREQLGLTGVGVAAKSMRLATLTMPVDCESGQGGEAALGLARVICQAVMGGRTVVVLADSRPDRAAAVVAVVLTLLGLSADEALRRVEGARHGALREEGWVRFVTDAWQTALALNLTVFPVPPAGTEGERSR